MLNLKFPQTLLLVLITVLLGLTGCANKPTHIFITTEINVEQPNIYADISSQLSVIDQRSAPHTIKILKENEPTQTLNSQESLNALLQTALQSAYKKQGISINNNADIKIEFLIDTALITVEQTLVSYTAKHELTLTVKVNKGNETLKNTFRSTAQNSGALKADLATLEKDFSKQISTLLTRVLENQEIISFLKK